MPRAFIGWSFPADLRDKIGAIAATLREELPHAAWTGPQTYHLTFAFLGDQDEDSLIRLEQALLSPISTVPAARTAVGEPGFFPSERRPRVGWLGVRDHEPVERIAGATRGAVEAEEIPFDDKPFHPHLTIVRPKTRWSHGDVQRFLGAWKSVQGHPLLVDSVTLFESRLGPGGATHTPRVVARCGS